MSVRADGELLTVRQREVCPWRSALISCFESKRAVMERLIPTPIHVFTWAEQRTGCPDTRDGMTAMFPGQAQQKTRGIFVIYVVAQIAIKPGKARGADRRGPRPDRNLPQGERDESCTTCKKAMTDQGASCSSKQGTDEDLMVRTAVN